MKNSKALKESNPSFIAEAPSTIRTVIFILEIAFVGGLLTVWFTFSSIRESKNLWILFFYNFPSQFSFATVPHEPVFLYFAKYYAPLIVTSISVAGTVLAEVLNYTVCKYIGDLGPVQKVSRGKFVRRLIDLFKKAPFTALIIAAFTPIPFYPFRFLVVLARYPLLKYLLAIFLARTPRFLLYAFLGYMVKIPDVILIILFALGVFIAFFFMRGVIKKSKKE
ncbi:MAG: VTT domain-containing protein [Candidatus Aminicenantales bacterium]